MDFKHFEGRHDQHFLPIAISIALHVAAIAAWPQRPSHASTEPPPIMVSLVTPAPKLQSPRLPQPQAMQTPAAPERSPTQAAEPESQAVRAALPAAAAPPAIAHPSEPRPLVQANLATRGATVPSATPSAVSSSAAPAAHAATRPNAAPAPAPAAVLPPSFDAAYLNNPAPTYPAASRRRGEEGQVIMRVYVSADGRAEQVELRESSGHERLDSAALEAVRTWRFVAARQGEKTVAAWVLVPLAFGLNH